METKANYLLIGAFTILGFLGLLGFVAWFSKTELDRQFAYYDVYFENVSGLDRASPVKFAGLAVGQVVDLALSERGDGRVRVRLEVAPETPLRADSIAKIEAQGVTGLSFVGLSGGSAQAALLPPGSEIGAGQSVLQALSDGAPEVLEQTLMALQQINSFASPDNQARVEEILGNLASSSQKFDTTLTHFSTVAENIGASVEEISNFTGQLEGMTSSVENTLHVAESALESIDVFADKAVETLDAGSVMLASADDTIQIAGAFIDTDLAALTADLTVTSATLRGQAELLSEDAMALLRTWEQTGEATTARLEQTEAMFADATGAIADLRKTLQSMEASSDGFNSLLSGEGAALVAEARQAMRSAERALVPLAEAAETDLPAIMADLRGTLARIDASASAISADLQAATGGLPDLSEAAMATLSEAQDSLARARISMDAMDRALASAETTFTAAEGTFTGAERIVNQDIAPLTESLRGTVGRFNQALDQVNADIPAITSGLRETATSAEAAARRIGAMAQDLEGPLARFANEGLTRYSQVAREAQTLLRLLESIAVKIERNPSRFLLGGETPTYRRR